MRAYSGMPSSEFIQQLRDVAIGAKASPLFIDAIDQLKDNESAVDEMATMGGELTNAQDDRDALRIALTRLVDILDNEIDLAEHVLDALRAANHTLENVY